MTRARTVSIALTGLLAWLLWVPLAESGAWLDPATTSSEIMECDTDQCIIDMAPPVYVYNNEWANTGGRYGSGSIGVTGLTSWWTSWDYDPRTDWSVIAYPSAILGWQWGYRFQQTGFPVPVSPGTPIWTTVAFTYTPDSSCSTGTPPRVCRLDVAYDLWLHDHPTNVGEPTSDTSDPQYEVMIWLAYSRELFSGTTPTYPNETIAERNWKVILQNPDSSRPIAVFMLLQDPENTAWSSGVPVGPGWNNATLNISEFTDWLVAHAAEFRFNPDWYIDSVQFGPEIDKGKGRLDVTYYTVAVGGTPQTGGGPYTLTVNMAGTGSGTVVSSPAGIDCGAACSASYDSNTTVTLTATAAAGSAFAGWSGCTASATDPSSCTVTLTADTTVTATFTLADCGTAPASGTSINAGGLDCLPYRADMYYSGGAAVTNYTGTIDTSGVSNPAPQAVYQAERYGAMTYTIPGLVPGAPYTVRLHFAENYWTKSGQRRFNVAINGKRVLTRFDVFAAAGAAHKAVVKEFSATANASGQVVIGFTNVVNYALINGIQVIKQVQ